MTFEELISLMREDFLNDNQEPYLWSPDTLLNNLVQAEKEACRRSHLLIDKSTPEVTEISLQQGVSSYTLHPSILTIHTAKLNGTSLPQLTPSEFEYYFADVMSANEDIPRFYAVRDLVNLEVAPLPKSTGDTLQLTVARLPIEDKTEVSSPEIPESLHYYLVYGALATCYAKQDTDTYNNKKASEFDALFSNFFGQPISARAEMRKKRFPPDMRIRGGAKKFGFM